MVNTYPYIFLKTSQIHVPLIPATGARERGTRTVLLDGRLLGHETLFMLDNVFGIGLTF